MEMTSLRSVVLLISIYFPPEFSGGATLAKNRATVFNRLGYSVYVIAGFPSYPTGRVADPKYKHRLIHVENIGRFTVIRVRLLKLRHEGYLKRLLLFLGFIIMCILFLPKILRITGKINIVYALAPILFSSIVGLVYSKLANSFFIYEAPDLWPEELSAFNVPLFSFIMLTGKFFAKVCYGLPDLIITTTKPMADYLLQEYKPKCNVHGVPLGVDRAEFPKLSKEESRQKLIDLKIFPRQIANKFIVMYAGLISSAYRIEDLVLAANKMKDSKEIVFIVIGDGEKREKITGLVKQYSLSNVYLLPFQPRNLLPYIYSSADVCTIPLTTEPIFQIVIPTKFYEYLACSKPIIAICRGELARVVNSNDVGIVVDFGDIDKLVNAIEAVRGSPDLVHMIERNSNKVLGTFSLDYITSLFGRILAKDYLRSARMR
jgi:glycosyltransferase involved in cell wall biosynthesis